MGHLLLPVAVLIILAIIAAVIKVLVQKGKAPADYPYQKEPTLFTPAERSFLGVLEQAIGDQFRIMGKVRLADVIKVKPGLSRPDWQKAFNRIQSKHLDFVCCDPSDLTVQFAVELDDKSHEREDRQDRDTFLDAAMKKAGVPVVRFAAKAEYSVQDVRETLERKLNEPVPIQPAAAVAQTAPASASPTAAMKCPVCGGEMVKRKAARGQNAGQEFWGCSNFPKCKKIVAI